jgi:hypothetical protein
MTNQQAAIIAQVTGKTIEQVLAERQQMIALSKRLDRADRALEQKAEAALDAAIESGQI